jgi:hypothetical protein
MLIRKTVQSEKNIYRRFPCRFHKRWQFPDFFLINNEICTCLILTSYHNVLRSCDSDKIQRSVKFDLVSTNCVFNKKIPETAIVYENSCNLQHTLCPLVTR